VKRGGCINHPKKFMKNFFTKHLKFCPKTGKFTGVKHVTGLSRLFFPLIGIAAIVWILIRVIPKPSRLSYPCVRTAMPIASGFIGYLVMMAVSAVALIRYKKSLRYYPVFFIAAFAIFGVSGFYMTNGSGGNNTLTVNMDVIANEPMGVAQGMFPGRVVWVHNPNSTNENCVADNYTHPWYFRENMNQNAVDSMISAAIQSLTGQTSDAAAWEAIFKFHNTTRGKGAVNYVPGEKIFIKINATSSYSYNGKDLTPTAYVSETSMASVLAVLRQLVNVVGVAQIDIYIGDPMKHIYKHLYDVWHGEFPNVHYLDNNYSTLGREIAVKGTIPRIFYADHGTILKDQVWDAGRQGTTPWYRDKIYKIIEDAEYMINIPMMKGHKRAGMTMFAKDHFGSHTMGDASHLHKGLVAPREMEVGGVERPGYGLYRVLVDIMTSSYLGKKNLVYIMDALWSTNYELNIPLKWQMEPFNDDWSSSIFASLDPVAIESVGYDFLRSEYTVGGDAVAYVQMDGVDDYLHQAADSTNWPVGIVYDPDSSGVHVYSLGVHEHWNDPDLKQYTRNLNPATGTGIELIDIEQGGTTGIASHFGGIPESYNLYQNYPNPFNPSTTITYSLPKSSSVQVTIYDMQGHAIRSFAYQSQPAGYQKVVWDGTNDSHKPLASGVYIYRVRASSLDNGKIFDKSSKMVLMK
jgi:hypothetical protein